MPYKPGRQPVLLGRLVQLLEVLCTGCLVSLPQALRALGCMEHRGACSADNDSGDGAGLMTQIPWKLLKKDFPGLNEDTTGCAPLLPGPAALAVGQPLPCQAAGPAVVCSRAMCATECCSTNACVSVGAVQQSLEVAPAAATHVKAATICSILQLVGAQGRQPQKDPGAAMSAPWGPVLGTLHMDITA
jgi:hypothetical protein